jgi:hypothetical protein
MENDMTLERKYLDTYMTELVELVLAVENDEDFVKNETNLCNWCEYKEHCSTDI